MWKRLVISLFVFMIIISISTIGFTANVDPSKYEVVTPKDESSSSNNKAMLISGKAPKGTNIMIKVYGAIDLTGEEYSLAKLPRQEDYILTSSLDVETGALGFAEEVELIHGINKIIIDFNVNGIDPEERVIYYYEVDKLIETLRKPSTIPSTK